VAFRYDINLVREDLARLAREKGLLRLITFCLVGFSLMLVVTYAIYLTFDKQITNEEERISDPARIIEEATEHLPETLAALYNQSEQGASDLALLKETVERSVPWSQVLLSLQECCEAGPTLLRTIESRVGPHTVALLVVGECESENPVAVVHAFMNAVAEQPMFAQGAVRSISREQEGPVTFEAEIPLAMFGPPPETEPEPEIEPADNG